MVGRITPTLIILIRLMLMLALPLIILARQLIRVDFIISPDSYSMTPISEQGILR